MADIQISTQTLTVAATTPTFTALNATDTYYVPNNTGRTVLYFKNTSGSISTVTFDVTKTLSGLSFVDPTFTIPATTGERVVGALNELLEQNAPQTGKLKFTQNVASGVTVAAFVN